MARLDALNEALVVERRPNPDSIPRRDDAAFLGGKAAQQPAQATAELPAIVRLDDALQAVDTQHPAVQTGIAIDRGHLGGVLFAVFTLGFTFATIAAALATTMSTWLALLITTGILLILTAVLAAVGYGLIRKATPPLPDQAIEEARLTTEALKSDGHT